MTEKRFKYKITDGFFDGDVLISIKEVVDLLNEQQSTIFKLQDLCGKSDGENAKLRIENKRLLFLERRADFSILYELFNWY